MTERVLSTRELNRALLAPATRRALEDEAERPAAFHDG